MSSGETSGISSAVLEYVRRGAKATKSQIRDHVFGEHDNTVNESRLNRALHKLVDSGQIVRSQRGVYQVAPASSGLSDEPSNTDDISTTAEPIAEKLQPARRVTSAAPPKRSQDVSRPPRLLEAAPEMKSAKLVQPTSHRVVPDKQAQPAETLQPKASLVISEEPVESAVVPAQRAPIEAEEVSTGHVVAQSQGKGFKAPRRPHSRLRDRAPMRKTKAAAIVVVATILWVAIPLAMVWFLGVFVAGLAYWPITAVFVWVVWRCAPSFTRPAPHYLADDLSAATVPGQASVGVDDTIDDSAMTAA